MLYSLHYKDKLIGLYDSLDDCNNFIEGIENQNWDNKNNFTIKEFKKNSIIFVRDINFKNKLTKVTKLSKEEKKEIKKSENYEKIEQDKIDLHNKMEKLKKKKEKILEMKNMYESDLNVFEAFLKKKSEDEKFEIPPIFSKKYEVIKLLKEKNNLNIENYYKLYKIEDQNNCWSGLFNQNE